MLNTRRNEFVEPRRSELALNEMRMLVLFALDVSSSVSESELRALERYVSRFREKVLEDSQAARNVEVAVITFGDRVSTLVDWCSIGDLPDITLVGEGLTDLNGGCLTAAQMIQEHGRKIAEGGAQMKKPYLITITDGCHTTGGDVEPAAAFIEERVKAGKLKHWFLGLEGYDKHAAAELTRGKPESATGKRSVVFEAEDAMSSCDFFDYAANSVKKVSVRVSDSLSDVDTPIGTSASNVGVVCLEDFIND